MDTFSEWFADYENWCWLIAGVVLMTSELFVPGVFVIWIGIAAFLTGVILSIFPEITASYQLLTFTGLSVVSVFFGWYVYGQLIAKAPKKEYVDLNGGAQSFVGNEYSLISDMVDGRGKVRVGDTVWLAQAKENLPAGTLVIVEKADGIVLHVKKKE